MTARLHQLIYMMLPSSFYFLYLKEVFFLRDEHLLNFEMSQEELEEFIIKLPEILKELEQEFTPAKL